MAGVYPSHTSNSRSYTIWLLFIIVFVQIARQIYLDLDDLLDLVSEGDHRLRLPQRWLLWASLLFSAHRHLSPGNKPRLHTSNTNDPSYKLTTGKLTRGGNQAVSTDTNGTQWRQLVVLVRCDGAREELLSSGECCGPLAVDACGMRTLMVHLQQCLMQVRG